MHFHRICRIICDFLQFPSVKSSKFFFYSILIPAGTNFKHKKVGFVKTVFQIFANLCVLALQNNSVHGQIDFPEKRVPTKVQYLLPVCQILRNFTEGHATKFATLSWVPLGSSVAETKFQLCP